MAISKFQIYDYWKDKAITNKFEIKTKSACTEGDDAIPITEFPDEIFCWACQAPPYKQGRIGHSAGFGIGTRFCKEPIFWRSP